MMTKSSFAVVRLIALSAMMMTMTLLMMSGDVSADTAFTKPPTKAPTTPPTPQPTLEPTTDPTPAPTKSPTESPTKAPVAPTTPPTFKPSKSPTPAPTPEPTDQPTFFPTAYPTGAPTQKPVAPTKRPRYTRTPTISPTKNPTSSPSSNPSGSPSGAPSSEPSSEPSPAPARATGGPTPEPSATPSEDPTRAPVDPTMNPTRNPTSEPTPSPTRAPLAPVAPTPNPTPFPTDSGAPKCGSLLTQKGDMTEGSQEIGSNGQMTLGPYSKKPLDMKDSEWECNNGKGNWFAKSYHAPSYAYSFVLTQRCEYQYKTPTTNSKDIDIFGSAQQSSAYATVNGVNAWFDAAAITFQRPDNSAYKVSDESIGFTGWTTPNYETDLYVTDIAGSDSEWCPEDYCVKITGDAIGYLTNNNKPTTTTTATKGSNTSDKFYSNKRERELEYETQEPTDELSGFVSNDGTIQLSSFESVGNTLRGSEVTTEQTSLSLDPKLTADPSPTPTPAPTPSPTETPIKAPDDPVDGASIELIYAFSHKDAKYDFYKMVHDAMKSSNNDNIFGTNHFLKCGCESFCMDDEPNEGQEQATCYAEEVCGKRIFKIQYKENYPEDKKPSWYEEGTTQVMEWFSACASAQHGCEKVPESEMKYSAPFEGTGYDRKSVRYPKVFQRTKYQGYEYIYGLGGTKGFPSATHGEKPMVAWYCSSKKAQKDLIDFGETIAATEFMRDAGLVDMSIPTKPCEPEIINPPEPPEVPPPVGPPCDDVNHNGFCIQLPGGTCYIREPTTCIEVDFVMQTSSNEYEYEAADNAGVDSSLRIFSDVAEWMQTCIDVGTDCTYYDGGGGSMLYNGYPNTNPIFDDYGWNLGLFNRVTKGQDTVTPKADIFYDCLSWEGVYGAKNFTDGAGDRYDAFGNSYGDLFTIEDIECTPDPTTSPSETPTTSVQPTSFPTMSPTVCSDSYLDSESLNIALVIDLSFSTYEKLFSSTVDIGDVNGDGKGNTILDAQVVAIQDLLTSISLSDSLNNTNTEIELISFETDAESHGVWKPLNDDGTYNEKLMNYVKKELRAPTSNQEVYDTNNGFTNFDAALDRTVQYFQEEATPKRLNLLVFLSDGEPNVRGDGDNEMYCSETTKFWAGNDDILQCSDLNLQPGERHEICRGDDPACVPEEPYQDCLRGPTKCLNADAVTQYDSEIGSLDELHVARLAIGVGDESNVSEGSALWMIDNNPGKELGVLPVQALSLEELSVALSNLCILNTDPPTGTPSKSPSDSPTTSPAPSTSPTVKASDSPSDLPSYSPTDFPDFVLITPEPTASPSVTPTGSPSSSPTASPSSSPSTSSPTRSPSGSPTASPSVSPSASPTTSPSESPSGSFYPSTAPSDGPTKSPAPSNAPTNSPSVLPSAAPTTIPSSSPTTSPSSSPSSGPTPSPSLSPTLSPTFSSAPTFLLPDCYDGPKLIQKDSSDMVMCYYNQDMVQINDMNNTEVTIAINNVWTSNALPEQLRVFVHTDGVDSVVTNNKNNNDDESTNGFQCLNNDGSDIDVEGDNNEFKVQCHRDEMVAGSPFLAVIDVVITDAYICGSNDVKHPCYPNGDPILESCSWRLIIPCDDNDMCTAEPSSTPSAGPTAVPTSSPTAGPSDGPSLSPTSSPSASPTLSPSIKLSAGPTAVPTSSPTAGPSDGPSLPPTSSPSASPTSSPSIKQSAGPSDGPSLSPSSSPIVSPTSSPSATTVAPTTAAPTVAPVKPPITIHETDDNYNDDTILGPEDCPDDILLIEHEGITPYPADSIRILSQDTTTVTIELSQLFTTTSSSIDFMFYQYNLDLFNNKCYEEDNVGSEASLEITIECTRTSKIALFEFWIADDISKGVLDIGDNAVIPECCHPDVPEGTPVTKYFIEIKCVTECPDVVQ